MGGTKSRTANMTKRTSKIIDSMNLVKPLNATPAGAQTSKLFSSSPLFWGPFQTDLEAHTGPMMNSLLVGAPAGVAFRGFTRFMLSMIFDVRFVMFAERDFV